MDSGSITTCHKITKRKEEDNQQLVHPEWRNFITQFGVMEGPHIHQKSDEWLAQMGKKRTRWEKFVFRTPLGTGGDL